MSPICSFPVYLPNGIFQNAALVPLSIIYVQSIWQYSSIELCMLIRAGQNILDSGGILPLDSSFASLTCWNEHPELVYLYKWML